MFYYFGFGSNINSIALKAKGVRPASSKVAVLCGWKLRFNVQHWFEHEGGMANIENTSQTEHHVEGVLHLCEDNDLAKLDQLEAYGIGYDRITVTVKTKSNTHKAFAYIGLPQVIDNSLLPTHRYKNIILKGAVEHKLSPNYIEKLRHHPTAEIPVYPKFQYRFDDKELKTYTTKSLSKKPYLTALGGYVFNMRDCRVELKSLFDIFGGKDMTLFHLRRLDCSDGNETLEDVAIGNISKQGKEYINTYLHAYQKEFDCVGKFMH